MAPIRTHDTQAEASTSTKQHKSRPGQPKRRQDQPGNDSVVLGVSKIKSSLRQTRRLLAKDNLAANVRVETERKFKALEAELAQAELANKERAMATRYHKIKFFERQKVTRKINQTKKQLSSATDDSAKKKLAKILHGLHVDLNYVLYYPKLRKYISLFPPEVRKDEQGSTAPAEDGVNTAQAREEVRSWVRSCMKKGELPEEPELHQDSDSKHKQKHKDWEGGGKSKKTARLKTNPQPVQEELNTVEEDDFFGEDDEDEES